MASVTANKFVLLLLAGLAFSLFAPLYASAQSTAFTYQGKLNDGPGLATGNYDFTFSLFDSDKGVGLVGSTSTNLAVQVVGGAFSVVLDFGANFPGADRWLQIGVRTNDNGDFTILSPRQRLTSVPYAITAGSFSGALSAIQVGNLTNHSDVNVLNLGPGQILIYDGIAWTNVSFGNNVTNVTPVALALAGTNVAVNASLGTHFRLVATTNFFLQNPTGAVDGQRLVFELIQDNAGGRTVALANLFKLSADLPAVNLTTNANGRDFMTCIASGTNFYVVGFIKGF
jgi:hypothetical protein